MKKIVVSALIALTLVSCGKKQESKQTQITTPTQKIVVKSPEEALATTQKAFIEKVDKLANYKETGVSKGKVSLEFTNKDGNAKGNVAYDVKFDQKNKAFDSSIDLNFDAKANIQDKKVKANGNVALKLIALKNKLFGQISKFDLNVEPKDDPQVSGQLAMVKAMVTNQIGKWYFSEIPEQENVNIDTKEFFTNKDKIVKILQKYPVFKSVKENKSKDFYDYDIVLNADNIVKIVEEINKNIDSKDKKELTKEDIEKLKKEISESDVKGNIKISKDDLRYFSLTLSSKKQQNTFKVDNLKDVFNFSIDDKVNKTLVGFKGKKGTGDKIEGKLEITKDGEKTAAGEIMVERNGDNFVFDGKFKDLKDETASFNIKIDDTTTEKKVEIKEPEGAIDIKQLQQSLMGGAPMGAPAGMPVGGELPQE